MSILMINAIYVLLTYLEIVAHLVINRKGSSRPLDWHYEIFGKKIPASCSKSS